MFEKDPRLKIIDLSRNFGHHKAAMTGLKHSKGDIVFLIDVDLEEEPELLNKFHEIYTQSDADVVYGVRSTHRKNIKQCLSAKLYYFLRNLLSSYKIPSNILVARLMSRRYVKSLLKHKEREFSIDGLWTMTGYKQIPVEASKDQKRHTTYTFKKNSAWLFDL